MFHVNRFPSGICEIRFDFQGRDAGEVSPTERRAFICLSHDLDIVNTWLKVLAVDIKYSLGTVYEYAKDLLYVIEWLAQEPVNAFTLEPVGHSLVSLKRSDLRTLFAWLDIPAQKQAEREHFVKTGVLPPGYREIALAPSTHNRRNAALSSFFNWVVFEYIPEAGARIDITENPLKYFKRPQARYQEIRHPDGPLPHSQHWKPEPSSPLRLHQAEDGTGPVVLTTSELQHVLAAIPLVSHGRNAANRNGAMIRLLLWGMLRKEELVDARWEAVDGDNLWVVGKGRKRRVVPIVDTHTWGYLRTYTNELQIPLEQRFHGSLLRQLDHEDRPITRHTVEHLIDSLQEHFVAKATSVKRHDPVTAQNFAALSDKLHSHIFRATAATFMARAGMSHIKLSLLLGHSDPTTTQRYYIAAQQLELTDEVRRICEKMTAKLEASPSSHSNDNLPDPRSWYKRRGLI